MALRRGSPWFLPGAGRVALARFVLVVLCAVPAWLIAHGALSGGPATNPYFFAGAGTGPLPWLSVVRLLREVGGAWTAGLALGALAALFLDQLLLAGAVRVLAPRRGPWDRPRLVPAVFRGGLGHLWPLLRAALLAFLAGGAGIALLSWLAGRLRDAGVRSGWWAYTTAIAIPLLVLLAGLLWLAVVAAWSLWTRVIVVADGRRRVRRAATVALGVFRRRPGRALAGPAAVLLAAALLPAAVLAAWRGSEPLGGAAIALFALGALAALLVQAWLWTRLVAAAVARYARPELDGLRFVPDAPFGILGALRARWRARRAASLPVAAAPPEP